MTSLLVLTTQQCLVVTVGPVHADDYGPLIVQTGMAALHLACSQSDVEMIKLLIEGGADLNSKDKMGMTPLHRSTADAKAMKLLVDGGADLNIEDQDGKTALFAACTQQKWDVISMLIKDGADVTVRNKAGNTVLMELAKDFASTARRVMASDTAIFSQLVSAGAMGQDGNRLMETLLSFQTWYSEQSEPGFLCRGCDYSQRRKPLCAAMIKSLLLAGADPAGKASNGEPFLTMAMEKPFREAALLLVKAIKGEPLDDAPEKS
eukprot:jgi/Mesvir1/19616/Mv09910-RA.2